LFFVFLRAEIYFPISPVADFLLHARRRYTSPYCPPLLSRFVARVRDFGFLKPKMHGYGTIIDTIFQAGIVEFWLTVAKI
jgi:hypothetical protein